MNWTDKIDQRQSALRLTFYMLVSMVLTIIRAGLDHRVGSACFAPELGDTHKNTHGATPFLDDTSLEDALNTYVQSTAPPPPEFYEAALTLLYAAAVVARMLGATGREIYELMKLADVLAQSLRGNTAHGAGLAGQVCVTAGRPAQARDPPDTS